MKKPLVIIAGLVGLGIVAVAGWLLVLPLFINQTVNEPLPFDLPTTEEAAQLSPEEAASMREQIRAELPDQAAVEAMPAEERMDMEQHVTGVLDAMPPVEVQEPMPEGMQQAEQPADTAEATPAEQPANAPVTEPVIVAQGSFQGADDFHQGSGNATVFQLPNGGGLLRFENFDVTNGPDLRVLLASGAAPTDHASLGDYLDLGELKGNMGAQNYEIPAGTDLSEYQHVVIYCRAFSVVFATATLS
jgi:hypothetical protein